jgi:hypothetical protein
MFPNRIHASLVQQSNQSLIPAGARITFAGAGNVADVLIPLQSFLAFAAASGRLFSESIYPGLVGMECGFGLALAGVQALRPPGSATGDGL